MKKEDGCALKRLWLETGGTVDVKKEEGGGGGKGGKRGGGGGGGGRRRKSGRDGKR